jgi:hypothetical protein
MNFSIKRVGNFSSVLRDSQFIQAISRPQDEILILSRNRNGRYVVSELVRDEWKTKLSFLSDVAYQFVQPMPGGNFLLVDSRLTKTDSRDAEAPYHAGKYFDNAHVFDETGKKLYGFIAGDGIEHVQTNANGEIWVGFFDEGVFGDPTRTGGLAAAGVVCFSPQGEVLFRYADQIADLHGIPPIDDCYALNVVDQNEVWLNYYGDFPVVALSKKTLKKAWMDFPRRAARTFAVSGETLLMVSAYRNPRWLEVDLKDRVVTEAPIVDDRGNPIELDLHFARGASVYFGANGRDDLYRATLRT